MKGIAMKYVELKEVGRGNGHVAFQIAKMEGIARDCGDIGTYNGVRLCSAGMPECDANGRALFLLGRGDDRDNAVCIATEKDCVKIEKSIRLFNEANKEPTLLERKQRKTSKSKGGK